MPCTFVAALTSVSLIGLSSDNYICRAGRGAAQHFKAKDPRAIDRDNAMRLLPPLKA
jgi:hypothetical protein